MEKREILEKFRIENSRGDEREEYLDLKSYSYGIIFSLITFVLIFIISNINNLDYTGAKLMVISIIVGNSIYKYHEDGKNMTTLRKFNNLFFIVGGGILYISYLVELVG